MTAAGTTVHALDDLATTEQHRAVLARKPFLRGIYDQWYTAVANALPSGDGAVFEVGTGAGFLEQFVPGLITSDIAPIGGVRVVLDAMRLPFQPGSCRAGVLVNVLHHIARPADFLTEAARVIRPGGALVMVEPWCSPWSSAVYRWHHEPFDPAAREWTVEGGGRLSDANSALPWILFERDRARLASECPEWRIDQIQPGMPFQYLLSGGMAFRASAPAVTQPAWRRVEAWLEPWMKHLAMFALIRLERRS